MSDEPPHGEPKKGWNCGMIALVILSVMLATWLLIPPPGQVQTNARMMQSASKARQIIFTLKNYAIDHFGRYPDEVEGVETSNDALRILFTKGLLEDEHAFTAASSPYEGDNNIGEAPDYTEALKAGENHWSLVAGMTDSSPGDQALVFENSANYDAWPPRWNCDKAGMKAEGRAWKSGKIIIGRNDGSVSGELLESVKGESVGLKNEERFFPAKHDGHRILDVERH